MTKCKHIFRKLKCLWAKVFRLFAVVRFNLLALIFFFICVYYGLDIVKKGTHLFK